MRQGALEERVEALRGFNRFFTRRIGVLGEGLLESPYTLTEARIMFEVAHREGSAASELARELGLDRGYMSRVLAGLEQIGLVEKSRSEEDGRRRRLSLTGEGREAFSELDERSRREISGMLGELSEEEQTRLLESMSAVESILSGTESPETFLLRQPEPGDLGWVVYRHGALYAREYGWDESFEALVARIVADFAEEHDPSSERCWIAEANGSNAGCVFLVRESETAAKLRLLLVEPGVRGSGLGRRLVEECVRFARRSGYESLTLWTNSVLGSARHIYQELGFELMDEEEHHSFGHDLIGQNWRLLL